jgi:hypothetical protein
MLSTDSSFFYFLGSPPFLGMCIVLVVLIFYQCRRSPTDCEALCQDILPKEAVLPVPENLLAYLKECASLVKDSKTYRSVYVDCTIPSSSACFLAFGLLPALRVEYKPLPPSCYAYQNVGALLFLEKVEDGYFRCLRCDACNWGAVIRAMRYLLPYPQPNVIHQASVSEADFLALEKSFIHFLSSGSSFCSRAC